MGICVGRSPAHASSVGLILNPRTGHVSLQFHVVYDDDFTTASYLRSGEVPPHWAQLVQVSSELPQINNQKDTWQLLSVEGLPDEGEFNSNNEPQQN